MSVREAVFARQGWYPADEAGCRQAVQGLLSEGRVQSGQDPAARAAIVPHAGWRFSGAVAAASVAALGPEPVERVFVFGGHMRPGQRPRVQIEGGFATPLGELSVDGALARELAERFDAEVETAERFTPDNSIELQLPLIKQRWPEARVVAMAVGADLLARDIGRFAAQRCLDRGLGAVALGSTDLTHYGDSYGFCPQGRGDEAHRWSKQVNDRGFLDALLDGAPERALQHALDEHSACCPGAALSAASFAAEFDATEAELLRHITSHEVLPQRPVKTWVGYASLVYREPRT